ncbi:MAG TPA: Uma2 family endonuclease [Methylomirabilota bacterium]|nr:Uma2 family endonuclease [Methylomirabilota bacterium]
MRASPTAAAGQPLSMTYEEFLDWCDEDTLAEWVDGQVMMTSPASEPHQTIVGFLVQVLGIYVIQRDLGRVLSAPFQMKLAPSRSGREPDLIFISKEHLSRLKHSYLDGPADLAVEVTSPESRLRDRGEKMAEYEMGGVQEYWIIDPEQRRTDYYVLAADGRYERKRADAQGIYRAEIIPGFWLKEEWLWLDPLPNPLTVLHELGIV